MAKRGTKLKKRRKESDLELQKAERDLSVASSAVLEMQNLNLCMSEEACLCRE